MFISDTKLRKRTKGAFIYLGFTLFIGLFSAIYEHFSFGVYSPYMMLAFLVPLALGFLPAIILAYNNIRIGRLAHDLQYAGVLTLTIGMLIRGALEIYGTTNRLTICYFLAGTILMILAATAAGFHLARQAGKARPVKNQ